MNDFALKKTGATRSKHQQDFCIILGHEIEVVQVQGSNPVLKLVSKIYIPISSFSLI